MKKLTLKSEAEMRDEREKATREAVIERHFICKCHEYKCMQRKLGSMYAPEGWTDRLIVWQGGVTDYVELKRPHGGKLERKQAKNHEQLLSRGCRVEILETKERVDAYFRLRANELGLRTPTPIVRRKRTAVLLQADDLL